MAGGAFVDQQHDDDGIGVVGGDGMRDVLHHHRLAALGRCHDQAALALADGGDDVDDPAGDVLVGQKVGALQKQHLVRVQRRQVLEEDLVLGVLGGRAVDAVHLHQREVALAILRRAHLTLDRVAGVQIEAADL